MLVIILNSICLSTIIGYFVYRRKHPNYNTVIDNKCYGYTCYNCSNNIGNDYTFNDDRLTLCHKCQRLTRFNKLFKIIDFISFKRFFILRKYQIRALILLVLVPFLIYTTSIFFPKSIFHTVMSPINSISMIFYWATQIFQIYLNKK